MHKVHILGHDEKSRFIAHALSGVYDAVELLAWKRPYYQKYRNINTGGTKYRQRQKDNIVVPLAVDTEAAPEDEKSRIDQLVVTGYGHEAVKALETVKDRLDKNSTICLMNEGLGVLERVRQRVFNGDVASSPTFLLGHMGHRLAFDRATESVKQLKSGMMRLAPVDYSTKHGEISWYQPRESHSQARMLKNLARAETLHSQMTPYDVWLRHKLPSVLFDSIVEPICVVLDTPYSGLLENSSARRMMHQLFDETLSVLQGFPEVSRSSAYDAFLHEKSTRYILYQGIIAKKGHPSRLAKQVANGVSIDIEHLNGYIIRRGQELGINVQLNEMIRNMVRAKHCQAVAKLNTYIPFEESSVPSDMEFRYRTLPEGS